MTRLSPLFFVASLLSPVAVSEAQAATKDTACTYDRCAVWIDGGTLRRGANGAVTLQDGFLHPMRLTTFVGGFDSASVWAERFEQRAGTGRLLSALGLLSMGAAAGTYYLRTRDLPAGAIDDANGFEAALVFGGAVSTIVGIFVRNSAEPARARAVWWYNRRFLP